jgi:hypothetical protein
MRIVWLVTAFLLALAGLARAEEMPDWSRPSVGEIAALAAISFDRGCSTTGAVQFSHRSCTRSLIPI